ncbi:MAG: T9SS type A sorting domain-containing protein [Sphingobacteriaceae bacterium]|nr:MAG: T9SS type A sorting domain-containing protein [Sphingobacteriaceae bacterium]
MKKIYTALAAMLFCFASYSQSLVISGQCISGSITLSPAGTIDGKPAYLGTGTILSTPGVELSVFWIGAPDNVWVIAFDGQPFYQNTCNTGIPPGTSPNICQWTFLAGNPACTGAPLVVTGSVVLPVTLTNFTATARTNDVLLNWKTAQETNNRGFMVERSTDGTRWSDLRFVDGAINSPSVSAYSYIDNLPNDGINFYRLRQEDLDGRITYSETVTASIKSKRFFTVSDNPGNGIYKINSLDNAVLEMTVSDASGKIIFTSKNITGNTLVDITKQAPGVYWLRVKNASEISTVKLIKL